MMLVYVKSFSNPSKRLTGVTAEKWPELLRDNIGGKIRPHLAKHELNSSEAQLSIADLVALYAPPVVVESA